MAVTHLRRSCPRDLMPARSPSLVLRTVKTTAVAEGTLVAAVFFLLLCRHPYLLRSSVGLCGSLVEVTKSCGSRWGLELIVRSLQGPVPASTASRDVVSTSSAYHRELTSSRCRQPTDDFLHRGLTSSAYWLGVEYPPPQLLSSNLGTT